MPTSSVDAEANAAPLRGDRWKWLVRLLLGLFVIGLLLAQHKGQEVRHALQAVSWRVVAGAVLCYWCLQTLSALKWQLLLRAQGAQLPLRECCRLYVVGMFWNLWMPTNIGGDAMRVYLVAPRCGGKAIAASAVLVERLTGFIALLVIGSIGLALRATHQQPLQINSGVGIHLIAAGSMALLLCITVFIILRQAAYKIEAKWPQQRLGGKWANLHRALDYYARPEHRSTLVLALALSFLFQSLFVGLHLGLARAIGLKVPVLVFWWLVPLLSIASLLPIGIGGLGVREAAAVALLSGEVTTTATVIAWSLLWQATVWLASLPGALWGFGTRSRIP